MNINIFKDIVELNDKKDVHMFILQISMDVNKNNFECLFFLC